MPALIGSVRDCSQSCAPLQALLIFISNGGWSVLAWTCEGSDSIASRIVIEIVVILASTSRVCENRRMYRVAILPRNQ